MNKRKIWLLSVAMSLALIGLILIQIYWVSNAYSTIRERFFRDVSQKLDVVIEKHEVLQTLAVIDEIDARGFIGTSNFDSQRQILAKSDSSEVIFKRYDINIEEVIFENSPQGRVRRQLESGIAGDRDTTRQGIIRGGIPTTDSTEVDFSRLRQNRDSKLFRLIRAFLQTYHTGDNTVSERRLDSLLSLEMKEISPNLNFRYEVIEEENDSIDSLYADGFRQMPGSNVIRKRLFPSSLVPHHTEMVIEVIDPARLILSKMKVILISSTLFIIIIIYSFIYTLNSLIRQGKLSEMKSDFINNMTHELKTPITTISLASEALLDRQVDMSPEKVNKLSKLISKENNRLKSQVERVLQMERLDRKKISLEMQELQLNEFLEDILNSLSIQVESKNGTIDWDLKADKDTIVGDPLHISNIFYNIVDNAIKYSTEKLDIDISSYRQGNKIFVDISDKGIGMNKEVLSRIFERFYRVPTGNLHDVKGFGLGLSYVKEMMQLHRGDVDVVSKLGKGSTFTLVFPLVKNQDQ